MALAEEGSGRLRSAVVEPLLRIRSSITSWALVSSKQHDVAAAPSASVGVLLLQQRPLDSLGRGPGARPPVLLKTFQPLPAPAPGGGQAEQQAEERVYDEPRPVRAPDPGLGPPRNLSLEFKEMFPPMRRIVMPQPKVDVKVRRCSVPSVPPSWNGSVTSEVIPEEGDDLPDDVTDSELDDDDLLVIDDDHHYHYPYGVQEPPYYDTPFCGLSDVNKVAIEVCPTPSPRYLTMRGAHDAPAAAELPKGEVFKLSLFSGSSHSSVFTERPPEGGEEDEEDDVEALLQPVAALDRLHATSDGVPSDYEETSLSQSDDGVGSVLMFPTAGAAGAAPSVTASHYSNVPSEATGGGPGSSWSLVSDDEEVQRPVFGDLFDSIKYNSLRRPRPDGDPSHYSNVSEYFDHQPDPAVLLPHLYSNTESLSVCSEAASSFHLSQSRSMQSVNLLAHVQLQLQPLDLSVPGRAEPHRDPPPPMPAPQPSPRKGAQVFRTQSYRRQRDNSVNPHRAALGALAALPALAPSSAPTLSELCIRALLRYVATCVRTLALT